MRNNKKSFAQTESGGYKGAITGGMQRKVVEDVTILGKVENFISWQTVQKLLSSGMNKEEVTEKLPEWKVIDKKSLELQTEPAFEPSQIAKMAPEDASFLIECLMNRLQEEFEQKQEEIYKHAGAFKGQDLTIPLGSKTIKIQGGTGEVGHISEKFIENEQKAAVGKFRLKEPYWRHRIFDDDYDNDGKPDSWIGSPTVKDAAKILANAIPGAGPALSFLIDAGDALYSGIVEGNWSAAAGMLGSAVAGFVPGGGSLLGNIASSFAKAGIKEAFSIIGEAASNGWDFKKIRLGEHLKSVAISGAVSSFNAWAGAKLGINYQKPALGDALKMAAVNFGSRTLSFALNEGFKAIEQGTDYRFDWERAARQLGANAGLSVVDTTAQVASSYWNSAYLESYGEHKDFVSRMGLRSADMLFEGVRTYVTELAEGVAAAWVEKGGQFTTADIAQASAMASSRAYQAMGETDREQVYLGIRGLIKKGIRLAGKALRWLGNKLWQGVKAAGRWAQDAVKNAWKHVRELPGALAAHFTHVERENRRGREGERRTEGKGEGPEAKAGEGTYTVKKGDTFWKIAKKKLREKLGREPTAQEIAEYAAYIEIKNSEGNREKEAQRKDGQLQFKLKEGEKLSLPEVKVVEEGGKKKVVYSEGEREEIREQLLADELAYVERRLAKLAAELRKDGKGLGELLPEGVEVEGEEKGQGKPSIEDMRIYKELADKLGDVSLAIDASALGSILLGGPVGLLAAEQLGTIGGITDATRACLYLTDALLTNDSESWKKAFSNFTGALVGALTARVGTIGVKAASYGWAYYWKISPKILKKLVPEIGHLAGKYAPRLTSTTIAFSETFAKKAFNKWTIETMEDWIEWNQPRLNHLLEE